MRTSRNSRRPTRTRGLIQALLALLIGCAFVFGTATTAQAANGVKMPNAVGVSAKTARAFLSEEGFDVKLKPKAHGPVIMASHWKVTKQSVKAGEQIEVGDKIMLTVKLKKKYAPAATEGAAAPSGGHSGEASEDASASDVPAEYTSALRSAQSYSETMHMSKEGIRAQLTSDVADKFSPEAADYAVEHVKADWNANALASAKSYQETMSMSPEAIRDQLTSDMADKFTPEQAAYAVQHLND
jgi:hypothetical protein